MRSTSLTILATAALALGSATVASAAPQGPPEAVVVVLHDGVDARDAAADAAREHRAAVSHVYNHALRGYAAVVPEGRLRALQRDPRVASVERDAPMSIAQATEQVVPTGITRSFADQVTSNTGTTLVGSGALVDVDVAVLDTGIDLEHPDLNVVRGVTCSTGSGGGPPWARTGASCDPGGDDDHYHGTHVAGTIGALDNGIGVVGVAPGARLHAVKVLGSSGSGYTSQIVAGIDWVVEQGNIEVLNMSLGGSGSCDGSAYDTAITNAAGSGVSVVVAAGNSDVDAANYSPASCADAFTVSALADFDGAPGSNGSPTCRSDQDDTLADFSNWDPVGDVVDVAAPGVCILSTYPIEQGEYATISGTSMASPHVAGAVALHMSRGASAASAEAAVVGSGNLDWTDDSGDGVQEPLLDLSGLTGVEVVGDSDPDPDPEPEPAGIDLAASAYKVKGVQHADLSWSGATSTNVDVLRNGSVVATTADDGAYTDSTGQKGGASATYQVCEAGTTTCSATVTVSW